MLARDPRDRATAREILQHEWMREHGCASDAPLQVEVVARMKQFAAMNRLKKEAMRVRGARATGELVGNCRGWCLTPMQRRRVVIWRGVDDGAPYGPIAWAVRYGRPTCGALCTSARPSD